LQFAVIIIANCPFIFAYNMQQVEWVNFIQKANCKLPIACCPLFYPIQIKKINK
jgi:hypothetical protein